MTDKKATEDQMAEAMAQAEASEAAKLSSWQHRALLAENNELVAYRSLVPRLVRDNDELSARCAALERALEERDSNQAE